MSPVDRENASPAKQNEDRPTWKRWQILLSVALLVLLLYFFWPLVGEIKAAANLFRTAEWIWLLVAILVQVVSYSFLTWLNALSLYPFSGSIRFIPLAGVLTSMAFISVAIPSAGLSGVALRVHLLSKYDYLPEESLFSLVVETSLELIALATVAVVGIAYLIQSGGLTKVNVIYLVLLGVLVTVIVVLVWRVLSNYERSRRVLKKFVNFWNRYGKKLTTLDFEELDQRLIFFNQNISRYPRSSAIKFPISAYGKVILDVVTLGVCFRLFGYTIAPATLLVGYGLILTVSGVSALPGGLVMTEAFIPVIFSRLGVPGPVAIAAGLTYRLIAFWLVRFVGYISWLILERRT
ncbi:MAG TPA: lysylphosphatidylglycerol synthase transmembrane domain-containing protein [Anaerolineales bacterium]|nr:lysylphosphatidylglycerol synthase transmembrane domain-containing protein [Anaerolineales bacterium]